MDILDREASEDEASRREKSVNRPPSHEANRELVEKERRFRGILQQAAESDETVRQKWDEWEKNIIELTWDEVGVFALFISNQYLLVMQVDLEASVPSARSNMSSPQTQMHARNLRILLEALDDTCKVRSEIVKRAERLTKTDDIQPRIMRAASGFERWVEVQPAMFEDVCDEEIAKYDKFLQELGECEKKQDEILEAIEACLLSCCIYVSVFNGGQRPATYPFCSLERTTHL
jgi:programmed cell death 6-interacting protein